MSVSAVPAGSSPSGFRSMVDLLHLRAAEQPRDRAYVVLADTGGEAAALTYAELLQRADDVAARLRRSGVPGDRALLLFPTGVEFLVAFFGCLIAEIVAVPIMAPRRDSARDASSSIVEDCAPRFVLTTSVLVAGPRAYLRERLERPGLEWIFVDELPPSSPSARSDVAIRRDDIAFLQYTSGSTSAPKGVIVTHGNLLANSQMIRDAFGNSRASTIVSWAPLYHDMGLILNALQAIYLGAPCVMMTPVRFVQRPLTWLRAIHEYRAEMAGGPNFAYELCVSRYRAEQMEGVDLSSWKVAFNGAEPVRARTLERFIDTFRPHGFDPRAMYPAYGMAEATLLISGRQRGVGIVSRRLSREGLHAHEARDPADESDAQTLVGCGRALPGERIAIVDPDSSRRLQPQQVGEVWVTGPNITRGYWQNVAATRAGVSVAIAGEDEAVWLRTGDLGFLEESGELYIVGRLKDLIIVRGVNHHPQDIENTAQDSHPALRRDGAAAFTVADEQGDERLVIVHEVDRTARQATIPDEIVGCIRENVVREHQIAIREIVLIRPGTLPKTTSGKVQRSLTRQLWARGGLSLY